MKNLSLIINIVLIIAVAVLFYLHFKGKSVSGSGGYESDTSLVNKGVIRIKYVDSDSITMNWLFSKELTEKFKADQLIREQKIQNMEQNLQSRFRSYENKAATMTERERMKEEEQLQALQNQYMRDGQELQQNAAVQEQQMMMQLGDSLKVFFPEFAKTVGADIILNNSSVVTTMFYVHPSLNVTNQAIKILNDRYNKFKKKED